MNLLNKAKKFFEKPVEKQREKIEKLQKIIEKLRVKARNLQKRIKKVEDVEKKENFLALLDLIKSEIK